MSKQDNLFYSALVHLCKLHEANKISKKLCLEKMKEYIDLYNEGKEIPFSIDAKEFFPLWFRGWQFQHPTEPKRIPEEV